LLVRWQYDVGERVVASGQQQLSGDDLGKQPVAHYLVALVPDPIFTKGTDADG
jgi:hypothetical protein